MSSKQYADRRLLAGDLVLEVSGGSEKQPVGRTLFVRTDTPGVIPSSFMRLLRFDLEAVDPWWMRLLMQHLYASGVTARLQTNTTSIRNLNVQALLDVEISLPPIPEQRRIVDLIRAFDAVLSSAADVMTGSELKLMALREQCCKGTSTITVGDALRRISAPVLVVPDMAYQELGVRSHGRGTFAKESIRGRDLGTKKIFWMQPSSLVFNIVFAWEGAVALLDEAAAGKVGSHRFPNYESALQSGAAFMAEYFRTGAGLQLLRLCSPGGAGRNRTLNQGALMASEVSVPAPEEWPDIVAILDAAAAESAAATRAVQAARNLRDNLVAALLSGEHEIPESYDELMERAS